MPLKILITDSFFRKSFDLISILANQGFTQKDLILTTEKRRDIRSLLTFGNKASLLRKNSFISFSYDLNQITKRYKGDKIIFIAIEEDTTLLFLEFTQKYGDQNFIYLLPSIEGFQIARNKHSLNTFCLSRSIPAPEMFTTNGLKNKCDFKPVLCKPRIGSGAKDFIFVNTPEDLKKIDNIDDSKYVIQELIPGGKEVKGAFFLCKNGVVISSYCHKRIRTFPKSGGVTILSELIENREIVEIGKELLNLLNWNGFAMIEFLWDPKTHNYKVIEINPRLWGSILLSEFSGKNFISNYISSCNELPIIKNSPQHNKFYIRWFFPMDLMSFLSSKLRIANFWKFKKDTCYINFTYANWWSIIWFHILFYINFRNVFLFIKRCAKQ